MIRIATRWSGPAALLASLSLLLPACIGKRRPQPQEEHATAVAAGPPGKVLGPDDVDDKLSELVTGERLQALYTDADPKRGAAAPLVTIVEYSDFQCPFCGKLATNIEEATADANDVRLVFKQFPLPMHADAEPGARAALAAHEQGKFWEMHDKLFANARAMKPANLERYAKDIGLDVEKFKGRLASDDLKKRVAEDTAMGKALKVTGTPAFFVNGRQFSGALPVDRIKSIIDDERKLALSLVEAGSTPEQVYARIMKAANPAEPQKAAEPAAKAPEAPEEQPGALAKGLSKVPNHAIPLIAGRPTRGPDDAVVTVIEYSSLNCGDCRKTASVLDEVAKKYPEVRFAFANVPGSDVVSTRAAKAGLAAHAQGKFWEFRAAAMAGEFDARKLLAIIAGLKLDADKFKADLSSAQTTASLATDLRLIDVFRDKETAPIVFVNGRALLGVPTFSAVEALIAEETKKANALLAEKKLAKDTKLYAKMVQSWRGWPDVKTALSPK